MPHCIFFEVFEFYIFQSFILTDNKLYCFIGAESIIKKDFCYNNQIIFKNKSLKMLSLWNIVQNTDWFIVV